MSYEIDNLEYSLAKRVPNMAHGFSIETDYGRIEISAEQAPKIVEAVRKALEKELNKVRP